MTGGLLSERLAAVLAEGRAAALVTVTRARGSTPREAGAAMLVEAGHVEGTIGGGRLEWSAIAAARALLAEGGARGELAVPLGPAAGQCCGGHVTVRIERAGGTALARLRAAEAAALAARPAILVFGAGHVGRALARALAPLPFRVRLIDGRAQEFQGLEAPGVECVVTERLCAEVEAAPPDAAYLVMTHSHALDAFLAASVIERGDFRYLGLIGSRTKRARFLNAFRQQGLPPARLDRLTCPIGGSTVRDKRPPVIAALATAEIITAFARQTASIAVGIHRQVA